CGINVYLRPSSCPCAPCSSCPYLRCDLPARYQRVHYLQQHHSFSFSWTPFSFSLVYPSSLSLHCLGFGRYHFPFLAAFHPDRPQHPWSCPKRIYASFWSPPRLSIGLA